MNTSKCPCLNCHNNISFDADNVGQIVICPHCENQTGLFIPVAQKKKSAFNKAIKIAFVIWIVAIIAGACLGYARNQAKETLIGITLLSGGVLSSILFYFTPTLLAKDAQKTNLEAIFLLNIFAGWTLIGWVGALIWACTVEKKS